MVYLPQAKGCLLLQGALAECGRELEGLLARRNGAVGVSCQPEYIGHPGQHPSQPGPIVERPGQGLGLAQQGEAPPMLSQVRSARHPKARRSSMASPLVSPGSGRCARAWRACSKVGHRLAERGAVVGPGTGLLAVGDGLVPHLAPQGMVRQAFDLLGPPLGRERLKGLDQARVQPPPPLQQAGYRRPPRASGHA